MTQAPQIYVPHPIRAYAARFVAPFLFMLIPGTGGAFEAEGMAQMGRWSSQQTVEIRRERQKAAADARTAALRVSEIRDRLSLNMSELAGLLKVSRPTAYAWLNGQPPQHESMARILRLSAIADRIGQIPENQAKGLLRQPLFANQSVIDLLKAEADASEAIAHISELAKAQAIKAKVARTSGRTVAPLEQGDVVSTPATYEPT